MGPQRSHKGRQRPCTAQTQDAAIDTGLREIHNRHFDILRASIHRSHKKTPLRSSEGACRRENCLITGRGGGTADGEAVSRSHQEPTINLQSALAGIGKCRRQAPARVVPNADGPRGTDSGARLLTIQAVHRTSTATAKTAGAAERGKPVSAGRATDATTARSGSPHASAAAGAGTAAGGVATATAATATATATAAATAAATATATTTTTTATAAGPPASAAAGPTAAATVTAATAAACATYAGTGAKAIPKSSGATKGTQPAATAATKAHATATTVPTASRRM